MAWEDLQRFRSSKVEDRIYLMKGTTTVGVKFKNGVVVASDKRATSGTFVASKSAVKTLKLTEYAVATISGLVADGQYLVNNLTTLADLYSLDTGKPLSVRGLARLLVLLLRRYRPYFLLAHLIVGGVDREGPHLFNVDLYGTMTEEDYLATGSGSPIAISIIEGGYSPDIDREKAIKLVISSMIAALSRDAATGDGMDVVVVDKEGVKFLGRDEISQIIREVGR